MPEYLILSPTPEHNRFRKPDGSVVAPPSDWARLPPGDAGLTRRVKAAGPSWQVIEVKGRKKFSQGLWAPAANITAARAVLEQERATPAYAKRREADTKRREQKQEAYVGEFSLAVLQFLDFAPEHAMLALTLADRVAAHATPVGSGTVARTERIPVEERAEAAVIAWMRHATTAYDRMTIARIKGRRREVRRELAEISRRILSRHRVGGVHDANLCKLCAALSNA